MFLGFDPQFEHHGEGGDSRATSLGSLGTKSYGSKGRFNGVGGPKMGPVKGWEVVKSEEPFFVFFHAVGRFWILGLITGNKLIIGCQSGFSGGRQRHFMD